MKTKTVPAIIMLTGGFITCVIGIINQQDTTTFVRNLLIVLVIFYIFGCVVKIVLDKNFPEMEETDEEAEVADEETEEKENVESDSEEDEE